MLAWTSSSGIPVQAYRMDMVAGGGGGDVGRRWRRRQGRGRWSGAGGDFLEQFFGYGRPCDHAVTSSNSSSSTTRPRSSSSTEWWAVLLCGRDVFPQCKLCGRPWKFSWCRSGSWFLTCPLLCIAKCVAYVPMITQRQVPAVQQWECLHSVHRQSGCFVVNRDRYRGVKLWSPQVQFLDKLFADCGYWPSMCQLSADRLLLHLY